MSRWMAGSMQNIQIKYRQTQEGELRKRESLFGKTPHNGGKGRGGGSGQVGTAMERGVLEDAGNLTEEGGDESLSTY